MVGLRLAISTRETDDTKLLVQLKPPLKWAGGKRWLVPHLQPYWKAIQNQLGSRVRLVEPFCGGLAVALGLNPSRALLNDANPHLINFYQALQDGLSVETRFENNRSYYLSVREKLNQAIQAGMANTKEAAAWFYYLNRTGYNGLCRFNQSGLYNVPFGRYKTISYRYDWMPYQSVLANWAFCQGDFSALQCDEYDFIYADPPYDVPFVSYSANGFSWEDQVRLAHWLADQPGPVIASNQATPRIIKLYQDLSFDIKRLDAPRRISCTGDRQPAKEMLAFKRIII